MSTYSLPEAQAKLPELIARARNGERVVIAEGDRELASLTPIANDRGAGPTPLGVDWLRARLQGAPAQEPAGDFVSRMRDEDWR
ncbi:MAG: type II toxin-antitoxin system prevent-host-death family antitoxin [Alphaproteobacteria bacterium]|nr:type II toxin-antitoxin system prevent-host-death family antitoxin [Alphaproteobacteria bacterium]